jgi:hypothetical protein
MFSSCAFSLGHVTYAYGWLKAITVLQISLLQIPKIHHVDFHVKQ